MVKLPAGPQSEEQATVATAAADLCNDKSSRVTIELVWPVETSKQRQKKNRKSELRPWKIPTQTAQVRFLNSSYASFGAPPNRAGAVAVGSPTCSHARSWPPHQREGGWVGHQPLWLWMRGLAAVQWPLVPFSPLAACEAFRASAATSASSSELLSMSLRTSLHTCRGNGSFDETLLRRHASASPPSSA